jgi:hypothetical protein
VLNFVRNFRVFLLLGFLSPPAFAAESSALAIVGGGVQPGEDAAFVSPSYSFLPGDFLYFTFLIGGFSAKVNSATDSRSISLHYEISVEDVPGVPLAKPVSGEISEDLSQEDKNWTPKRRVSFQIPSFVANGDCHVHVVVQDLLSKTQTNGDYPFHIGGPKIDRSSEITVQNFEFHRTENDKDALEVPAYSPGDHVYGRFDITGYKLGAGNAVRVSYGINVLSPDGKPYVQQPRAAEIEYSSFYPAQFVPGSINVTTSASSVRGQYIIVLTVRDLVGNKEHELKRAFSIE